MSGEGGEGEAWPSRECEHKSRHFDPKSCLTSLRSLTSAVWWKGSPLVGFGGEPNMCVYGGGLAIPCRFWQGNCPPLYILDLFFIFIYFLFPEEELKLLSFSVFLKEKL